MVLPLSAPAKVQFILPGASAYRLLYRARTSGPLRAQPTSANRLDPIAFSRQTYRCRRDQFDWIDKVPVWRIRKTWDRSH